MISFAYASPTKMACLFSAIALFLALQSGCDKPAASQPPPKLQEVLYVTPIHQTVTEYEEFTGRTAPKETVDVRARVSGYLEEVAFEDGAMVEEGQVLFRIDDQTYKAEALRAAAAVKQFEARVDRLTKQDKRARQLTQTQAITQEEYDTIIGDKNEAQASLDAALAMQKIAELNVSYTEVKSPISGRISRRLVDRGNLVRADDSILATIVAVDPVYVYFDMDERTVLRMKRLVRSGQVKSTREAEVQVQIALADETEFNHVGTVNFVDNQVDPATGTLRYRAEIDNKDRFYSPGLFVRLRFPIGEPHPAILVPEMALSTDQGQRFLYVVDEANKIAYRRVATGMLFDGMRVITEGVEAGDRVVVTGLQRIRPGLEVLPRASSEVKDPVATEGKPTKPSKTSVAESH
jgi:RND family efflux transporter MFP subunit